MNVDLSFLTTLVSGGVIWQVLKTCGSVVFKRWSDKNQAQSKLLLADVERLGAMVDPLFKLAMTYYGAPSDAGVQTARSIKMDMKSFAMQWNSVNNQTTRIRGTALDTSLLIAFRQSLTSMLDVDRPHPLAIDDPTVGAIFLSTQKIRDALSTIRYEFA